MTAPRLLVLTVARMRAADAAATAAGTPVATLMERAGAGAVQAIERHYGRMHGWRVAVVAGKGNNGGDGRVVARLLAARGARVTVHAVGEGAADLAPELDLVVDALLGTGSRGALSAPYAAAVAAIAVARARSARVVALDLPSGLDADTGRPWVDGGPFVRADLTVAFAHLKPVHVLVAGREPCGAIAVVDIGVEPGDDLDPELSSDAMIAGLLPQRAADAHKSACGRVLVIGGSVGLTGAVVLASTAALRAGAGLVTAGVPTSLNDGLEAAMIEPMTWPLPESPERALSEAAAPMVLARAGQAQVVALGPGLSRSPEAAALARHVVAAAHAPIVLDADGLNAFAGHGDALAQRVAGMALVVTPHVGEMVRLTGLDAATIERDRLTLPAQMAKRWNAVVVLKGAPTVTASPDGRTTVNATGNPGLATAGTGDVLTGVLAGFVAQGLAPYDAARAAVHVHGLAADIAHARVGTLALVAGDVTAALPQALCRLQPAGSRSDLIPLPQARIAPAPPDGFRNE